LQEFYTAANFTAAPQQAFAAAVAKTLHVSVSLVQMNMGRHLLAAKHLSVTVLFIVTTTVDKQAIIAALSGPGSNMTAALAESFAAAGLPAPTLLSVVDASTPPPPPTGPSAGTVTGIVFIVLFAVGATGLAIRYRSRFRLGAALAPSDVELLMAPGAKQGMRRGEAVMEYARSSKE